MRFRGFSQTRYVYVATALFILFISLIVYKMTTQHSGIPPSLVINLDSRPDRWAAIQSNARAVGWPALERVPAVKAEKGWKGCAASHLKCIRIAKERGYPAVLILEDDCVLAPHAAKQFRALLPQLTARAGEWDIFMAGVTFPKEIHPVAQNLYQVRAYTTHFCYIPATAYDKILNNYDDSKQIDVFYNDTLRIWTTVPFFATQRDDYSNIEKRKISYKKLFEDAEIAIPLSANVKPTLKGGLAFGT